MTATIRAARTFEYLKHHSNGIFKDCAITGLQVVLLPRRPDPCCSLPSIYPTDSVTLSLFLSSDICNISQTFAMQFPYHIRAFQIREKTPSQICFISRTDLLSPVEAREPIAQTSKYADYKHRQPSSSACPQVALPLHSLL
jgi:hypothetical protein